MNKPIPSTGSMIQENLGNFCKCCGSSSKRKYIFFGPLVCINPECKTNTKFCVDCQYYSEFNPDSFEQYCKKINQNNYFVDEVTGEKEFVPEKIYNSRHFKCKGKLFKFKG